MTGLHVYGALLMLMSFVTGGVMKDGPTVAAALVATAAAALGEAINEMNRVGLIKDRWRDPLSLIAPSSWVLTAAAFVFAFVALFL